MHSPPLLPMYSLCEASLFTDLKQEWMFSFMRSEVNRIQYVLNAIRSTSYQIYEGASLTYHRTGSPYMICCVRCARVLTCLFLPPPNKDSDYRFGRFRPSISFYKVRLFRAYAHCGARCTAEAL